MIFKNATVLDENFRFVNKDLVVDGSRFAESNGKEDATTIDCTGKIIIPGLIDIHTHGCDGCDNCDSTRESLETIAKYQASNGITSFLSTTMTLSEEQLGDAFQNVYQYMQHPADGAYIHGINMEGPFLNPEKKGAQNGKYIHKPDVAMFRRLNEKSGNNVKLVALAPELEGADKFIAELKNEVRISIAHTCASYEQAMQAIAAGAKHATHLFNAMPSFSHRNPSVVGAAFDSDVTPELISDGIHVHPAMIRLTFSAFGADRIILISDSMRATGLQDGTYDLGGLTVYVKDKKATLVDGTIAGSSTNLMECVKKAISFGIPAEDAIKCASLNPAKAIGADQLCGSIQAGKYADFVILDEQYTVEQVYIKGKKFK